MLLVEQVAGRRLEQVERAPRPLADGGLRAEAERRELLALRERAARLLGGRLVGGPRIVVLLRVRAQLRARLRVRVRLVRARGPLVGRAHEQMRARLCGGQIEFEEVALDAPLEHLALEQEHL